MGGLVSGGESELPGFGYQEHDTATSQAFRNNISSKPRPPGGPPPRRRPPQQRRTNGRTHVTRKPASARVVLPDYPRTVRLVCISARSLRAPSHIGQISTLATATVQYAGNDDEEKTESDVTFDALFPARAGPNPVWVSEDELKALVEEKEDKPPTSLLSPSSFRKPFMQLKPSSSSSGGYIPPSSPSHTTLPARETIEQWTADSPTAGSRQRSDTLPTEREHGFDVTQSSCSEESPVGDLQPDQDGGMGEGHTEQQHTEEEGGGHKNTGDGEDKEEQKEEEEVEEEEHTVRCWNVTFRHPEDCIFLRVVHSREDSDEQSDPVTIGYTTVTAAAIESILSKAQKSRVAHNCTLWRDRPSVTSPTGADHTETPTDRKSPPLELKRQMSERMTVGGLRVFIIMPDAVVRRPRPPPTPPPRRLRSRPRFSRKQREELKKSSLAATISRWVQPIVQWHTEFTAPRAVRERQQRQRRSEQTSPSSSTATTTTRIDSFVPPPTTAFSSRPPSSIDDVESDAPAPYEAMQD